MFCDSSVELAAVFSSQRTLFVYFVGSIHQFLSAVVEAAEFAGFYRALPADGDGFPARRLGANGFVLVVASPRTAGGHGKLPRNDDPLSFFSSFLEFASGFGDWKLCAPSRFRWAFSFS